MRWKRLTTLGLYAGLALVPVVSWGQQVHFDSCNATTTAGLLLVSGQVAGLGNQMRPPTPLHDGSHRDGGLCRPNDHAPDGRRECLGIRQQDVPSEEWQSRVCLCRAGPRRAAV